MRSDLRWAVALIGTIAASASGACAVGDDAEADRTSQVIRARDAPPPAIVRVGLFSASLPIQVALARGFFTDENLTITTQQVTTSISLFQAIAAGTTDIALTSADNPLNYARNQNNAVNHGAGTLDVQMIFGDHLGLGLALAVRPGLTLELLRDKRCGVDAPDSGFAYVLYEMLRRHGLARDVDYTVVVAGGTPLRLAALRAGTIDCTLLNADSVVRAREDGFAILATIGDVAVPYLGGVGAARKTWLQANSDVAVRFIRAYERALSWALDPANRDAVVTLLSNASTPAELARKIYNATVNDPTGLIRRARFDTEGLLRVIELRAAFGGFEQPEDPSVLASPAGGLFDLRYRHQALHRVPQRD